MFMHFRCATKQLPCKHRAGVKERSGGEEWVAYWKLLPTAANPLGILSSCCLAGWLPLACCPIPCLISACSMPVATRSLPASACSLSSFLPPMLLLLLISLLPPLLPHSCILLCLLFCFIPASSLVSSRAYPSLFSLLLLPPLPRGRQYLWQCDQWVVGCRLWPYRSLVSMSMSMLVWGSTKGERGAVGCGSWGRIRVSFICLQLVVAPWRGMFCSLLLLPLWLAKYCGWSAACARTRLSLAAHMINR